MKCPHCSDKIVARTDTGAVRVRVDGAITIADGQLSSACYWCRKPVQIPMEELTSGSAAVAPVEPAFTLPAPPAKAPAVERGVTLVLRSR